MIEEKKQTIEKQKEEPIKNGGKKVLEGRDEKGRFVEGEYPGGPGRPKGLRDWSTDFNEAIKVVAKQTGKKESEIRTELLIRGISEARSGNFNFWREIIDRDYGKLMQPIEAEIDIPGAKEMADKLQELLNAKSDTKKSDKESNTDVLQGQKGKSISDN